MRRILLLALGSFALGTDAFIVAGLIPDISAETGIAEGDVGQLVTVFTVCFAVSGPLLSSVLRFDTRTLLLTAMAVFTLGNVGSALSDSLAALLLTRAVAGIGAGLYSPTAAATAAALAPPGQRGRALSLILAGLSIGTVVGVPLGLMLAADLGWRSAFWLVSALGVLAALGIWRLVPRIALTAPPGVRDRLATLFDPRVAPVVAVSLLFNVASLGLYTYIAPILQITAGVDSPLPFLWAWGVGGVIGALAIGPLIDRASSATRVMPAVLGVFILAAAAITPAGGALLVVGIALGAWGAAGFASPPPQQHLLLERAPDRGVSAVAVNGSAIYLGGAVGSGLGGVALHLQVSAAVLPLIAAGIGAVALVTYLVFVDR